MTNLVTVDLYREEYWEVHDPGEGKIVAHFFDGDMADDYVKWLNKKIVKKRESQV